MIEVDNLQMANSDGFRSSFVKTEPCDEYELEETNSSQ